MRSAFFLVTVFLAIASCVALDAPEKPQRKTIIRSEANPSKCLDIYNDRPVKGALVWMHDCNDTRAQVWEFTPGIIQPLKPVGGDLCVSVGKVSSALQDCHHDTTQFWKFSTSGFEPGHGTFVLDYYPARCLTMNGYQVIASDCESGNKNQIWIVA